MPVQTTNRLTRLPRFYEPGEEPPKPKAKAPKAPKKDANRWQEFNHVVDVVMRDLPPAQLAVWVVLFRDERGGVSKSAQTYIATRCGLSRESVSRAIAGLVRRGLVTILRKGGINKGFSWYRLTHYTKH